MTVFASKAAFLSLGLEQVQPSTTYLTEDCSICKKPLAVHDNHASPRSLVRGYHTAARITTCGHMHGQACLSAWLDVGNSCPTCARILFEFTGDRITQKDINDVVHTLGPQYGEARVTVAVVAVMQKREREQMELRRFHEQEVAVQKKKDTEKMDEEFTLGDDDFLDSEEDFGGDDEEQEEGFEVDDDDDDESKIA